MSLHEVLPQKSKPSEKCVKRCENMDLTSTYRHDHNSYTMSQVSPCLSWRMRRHIPSTEMDMGTTYKGKLPLQLCSGLHG